MLTPGFEWYVAWRYIKDDRARPGRKLLVTSILLLVLGIAALLYADHMGGGLEITYFGLDARRRQFQAAGAIGLALAPLFGFVAVLRLLKVSVFTVVSMMGVFVGSAAPVIVLSVMSGFELDLKSKIAGLNAHVQVNAAEGMPMRDWEPVLARVRAVPGVKAATPHLEAEVMLRNDANGHAAEVRGIDPATVGDVTVLKEAVKAGKLEYLTRPEELAKLRPTFEPEEEPAEDRKPDDRKPGPDRPPAPQADKPRKVLPGLIVGQELAKSLRLYVGDDVQVVCAACGVSPSGPIPNEKPFRVAGLFFTGMYEYDTLKVYMSLEAAQKFLHQPGEITAIEVKAVDHERTTELAAAISAALGPGYEVKDWQELNRSLFSALRLEKIAMFIVLTFIVIVASFSIVSNLIMVVMEKGKEIAILKSMGASDRGIVRIFLIEGLYIAAVGMAVGLAYGLLWCYALTRWGLPLDPEVYYISKLPVEVDRMEVLGVAGCALAISVLATIYPAILASRLRPIEGLRYE